MIYFGAALLSDAVSTRDNLLSVLSGGFSRLERSSFPAPIAAQLGVMLYFDAPVGVTIEQELVIRGLQTGVDEPLFEAILNFGIIGGIDGLEAMALGVPLENAGIPEPGRYSIQILINGDLIGEVPFIAALGGPPSSETPAAYDAS